MKPVTLDQVRLAFEAKGYEFFENEDYNLNLFGIRSKDLHSNEFNDLICVAFKVAGVWQLLQFDATTDPGLTHRLKPINDKGVGFLVEGQHRGAYQLGKHKGRYTALIQNKALKCYRDNDHDALLEADESQIDEGWHGANIHRASEHRKSKQVDGWSAMCQVIADPWEYDILIAICEKAAEIWGNRFTYTLLNERDIPSPKSIGV